jgi:hypothetical protein
MHLLVSLIQRMIELYTSLLHTHTSVYSQVSTNPCIVAISNGRPSPCSGFPNSTRSQLPDSHSNSSQRPPCGTVVNSNSLTDQLSQPTDFFEGEREVKVGGGDSERDYRCVCVGGGNRNKICGFEGSQAVPTSPSGTGEACMRDLFNYNF